MQATFHSVQQIKEFKKAFQSNAGGETDILSLTDGQALSMVSLEETMVQMVQSQEAYKFLNKMERRPVRNVVSIYNVLSGYGDNGEDSFVDDIENAQIKDVEIDRERAVVSFLAEGYKVAKGLQEEETVEDPEQVQRMGATMRILNTLAHSNWYGDKTIKKKGYNGFIKTTEANGTIYDCEGKFPSISLFKEIATEVQINSGTGKIIGGIADSAWMPLAVKNALDNFYIENGDFLLAPPGTNPNTNIGYNIPALNGAPLKNGVLKFETDLTMNRYAQGVPLVRNPAWASNRSLPKYVEGKTHTESPDTPAITAVNTGVAVAGSKWNAADILDKTNTAAQVGYRVVAGNDKGRSIASAPVLSTGVLVAGEAVDITITPAVTGQAATYFEIYRETYPGSGNYKYVTSVENTGSPTVYQDLNAWRPGTDCIVIGQFDSIPNSMQRTYAMYELLPLVNTKFPQTVANMRGISGMVEFYGGLIINAPLKFYTLKNIPVNGLV